MKITLRKAVTTNLFAMLHRLSLWPGRLRAIRGLSTDSLELGLAVLNLMVGGAVSYPSAAERSAPALVALHSWLPYIAWAWTLIPCALLSFLGYLDDNGFLRRMASFSAFIFWFYTGLIFWSKHPDFYGAYIHLVLSGLFYWVYQRVGVFLVKRDYERKIAARQEAARQEVWKSLGLPSHI